MEANVDRDVDRSKWGRGLLRSPTGWETGESARRFHGRGLERKVLFYYPDSGPLSLEWTGRGAADLW